MSDVELFRVWESPTNEGTACYQIGKEAAYKAGWTPAVMRYWPADGQNEGRVEIWDEEKRLRVSLPSIATALEYRPVEARDVEL